MALANLRAVIKLEGVETAKRNLRELGHEFHQTAAEASRAAVDIARTGAAIAAVAGSMAAFGAAVQRDSLIRSLAATSESVADLRGQLARLKEIAKLPGLGFEEAIQGSVALQSAGLSADLAERSLRAFGNALALAGKGKDDLQGVIVALSQISSKGVVSAEEINQIAERVPQVRGLLKDAFGTADTEKIQKLGISSAEAISMLVSAAEKLTTASGGIGNAIENAKDRLKDSIIPLGQGLTEAFMAASPAVDKFLTTLETRLRQVGEVIAAIGKSGLLGKFIDNLRGLMGGDNFQKAFITGFANVVSVFQNFMPVMRKTAAYLADVFRVAASNVVIAWDYAVNYLASKTAAIRNFFTESFKAIGEYITEIFSGVKEYFDQNLGPILKALGAAVGYIAGLIASVNKSMGGAQVEAIRKISESWNKVGDPVAAPKWKHMTAPAPKWSDFLSGSSELRDKLLKNLGPLSDLPDGLILGGPKKATEDNAGSVVALWDKYLADIEKNTSKTNDILSGRQVVGGGSRASLGVTAAELSEFRQRPDPYTRSVASSFQEAANRAYHQWKGKNSSRAYSR